ncbi:cupin domain-containing protein [Pontibacter diazotrophicus]|uniref:Cupin domain-containing protein n=1 Tax=Pontibacter diazotrophicus TaxID=1400979 RepID=A0A3D8L385_9BACT|nr:cupin domain-containing protein [Pontibacter diazotrophicus]RDV11840.1 cupin domain-containing protein [Pontibacter diazotrophicus]
MQKSLNQLPVTLEVPGAKITSEAFGDITVAFTSLSKGTDLAPLLEGLPHDHCQCPHWGYVMKGKIRIRYQDGTEEVTEGGNLYYWPAGHTGVVEEDVEFIEFSPKHEMEHVLQHVKAKLEQAAH